VFWRTVHGADGDVGTVEAAGDLDVDLREEAPFGVVSSFVVFCLACSEKSVLAGHAVEAGSGDPCSEEGEVGEVPDGRLAVGLESVFPFMLIRLTPLEGDSHGG